VRGRGSAAVLLAWAVLLGINTGVLVALGGDVLPVALLGGAAVGTAVLAAVVAVRARRDDERWAVTSASPAAALAAIALAGLVLGAELGLWLLLISGGALLLAIGGLLRERRAQP
jgi:hypothetical protein